MGLKVNKSNYSGEILEKILTKAVTGNELVTKRLIHVEPGVSPAGFHIPRLRTGKMLQRHKEMPTSADGKGGFTYDEVTLKPQKFMAFTTFNPASFEAIWRPFQPKGNLVFSELPDEVQETLLSELLKQVEFELGDHLINGVEGDGEDEFFNGFVTRIVSNNSVHRVNSSATTMIERLEALYQAIPTTLRQNPGLRILMSQTDWDKYDSELSARHHKGADITDQNVSRYKGRTIEVLSQWPDNLLVATICGDDYSTNLWAACNLQDDASVVLIDKLSNAGELYFMKILLTMDTNIAFGDEVVLLDQRNASEVERFIRAVPTEIIIPSEGGVYSSLVSSSGEYTIAGSHAGFQVSKGEGGILITAGANTTEADRAGTIELQLKGSSEKVVVEVFQGNGK